MRAWVYACMFVHEYVPLPLLLCVAACVEHVRFLFLAPCHGSEALVTSSARLLVSFGHEVVKLPLLVLHIYRTVGVGTATALRAVGTATARHDDAGCKLDL